MMLDGINEWGDGFCYRIGLRFLVVVCVVPVIFGPGCGEEEATDDERDETCSEQLSDRVILENELAEEQGFTHIDYEIEPERQKGEAVVYGEGDNEKGIVTFEGGQEDSTVQSEIVYNSSVQEEYARLTKEVGVVSSPSSSVELISDPVVYLRHSVETETGTLKFAGIGAMNETNPSHQDRDNPLIDMQRFEVRWISGNGESESEETLTVISDGDPQLDDEEIESWSDQHIRHGGDVIEELAGIFGDAKVLEHFRDIEQICRGSDRANGQRRLAQSTACETQESAGYAADLTATFAISFLASLALPAFSGLVAIGMESDGGHVLASTLGGGAAIAVTITGAAMLKAKGFALVVTLLYMSLPVVAAALIGAVLIYGAASVACGNPLKFSIRGTAYPFRKRGEFIWYTRNGTDSRTIQVRQTPNEASRCAGGTLIEAVAVGDEERQLALYADRDEVLWIEGEPRDGDDYFWELDDGTTVERRAITEGADETYVVETPAGEQLRVDVFGDRLDIELDVPDHLEDQARGLVGNHKTADGEPGLRLRDGEVLEQPVSWRDLHERFGQSWQIEAGESLFDYRAGESVADFAADDEVPPRRSLEELSDEQLQYADWVCRQNGEITDPTLLRHCMLDVGCTDDPTYMRTFARIEPPKRNLEIVDEEGRPAVEPLDTERLETLDIPGVSPAGEVETAETAIGDACPADIEHSAESVGSSEIRTVDGLTYDFRAAGEFVLVESRADDWPTVHVRQQPAGGSRCPEARHNTAVAARLGDHRIAFYAVDDQEGRIRIDGESLDVAGGFEVIGDGHTLVRVEQDHYFLEWPDGTWLDVRFDPSHERLNIRFNAYYQQMGKLQGLFGQFNGYPDNDLALRNGTELQGPDHDRIHGEYADSWRISQQESLLDYADGESTEDFTDPSVPQSTLTVADVPADEEDAARQDCQEAGVDEGVVMEDCIIDVYCTGDPDVADEHTDRDGPSAEGEEDDEEWVEKVPGSGDHCCHVDCPGGPDDECGFVCGTGEFEEPHDWCEGDCPEGPDDCEGAESDDGCTWEEFESEYDDHQQAAYICATRCAEQTQTECVDDDGCCPPAGHCTTPMDNDCDIEPRVGSGCIEDDDCAAIADGQPDSTAVGCLEQEDSEIFGGVCTADCQDDSDCPVDSHCATDELHAGGASDPVAAPYDAVDETCVPNCDSDADCPREGFSCYDANGDGRTECWHVGVGDADWGEECELSHDCGEIGEGAVCMLDNRYIPVTGGALGDENERRVCTQSCGSDADCPDGWNCDGDYEICMRPSSGDGIGGECQDHQDCDHTIANPYGWQRCLDAGEHHAVDLEDGFCTQPCSDDSECPDGTRCPAWDALFDSAGRPAPDLGQEPTMAGESYCVPECDDDSDCPRDGYGCLDPNLDGATGCWHVGVGDGDWGEDCQWSSDCGEIGEHAICRAREDAGPDEARCTRYCGVAGLDCPDDWICGTQEGQSVHSCVPVVDNEQIGESCTADEDCGQAPDVQAMEVQCHDQGWTMMEGGYCHIQGCVSDEECPDGTHCAQDMLYDGVVQFHSQSCVASCETDADCPRDGYRCYDANGDGRTECWQYGEGTGDYGDSCESTADCQFGEEAVCASVGGELVCTTSCGDDLGGCPDGYGCSQATVGACYQECDDDSDCPDGASCQPNAVVDEDGDWSAGCV